MSEADYVCVLDTGSTDDTVQKLKARGAIVDRKVIVPWRFDVARNESMRLIPADADVCVTTDLDELFEKGWAEKVRAAWTEDAEMFSYYFIPGRTPSGGPADVFYRDRIHANRPDLYHWVFSVHEVLDRPKTTKMGYLKDVVCHHFPDVAKQRSYMEPLILEYNENPKNMRNLFLLARDNFPYHPENVIKYMALFADQAPMEMMYEKAFGLGLLGYAYIMLNKIEDAKKAFVRSFNTAMVHRMPMLGMATCFIQEENYEASLFYIALSLTITEKFLLYPDDARCWEDRPHLLAYVCYYHLGKYDLALKSLEEGMKYKKGPDMDKARQDLLDLLKPGLTFDE